MEMQTRTGDGMGPQVVSAGTVTGNAVRNSKGEDLGKIEEIMLDSARGKVAYAVLSFGGFMGMGDKLFALPWEALTLDTEEKCFILDVDQSVLEAAPGFDKNHWPNFADSSWGRGIYEHYGATPYWD
jgi:sporulation protein YlmC with PRC-barrel domain